MYDIMAQLGFSDTMYNFITALSNSWTTSVNSFVVVRFGKLKKKMENGGYNANLVTHSCNVYLGFGKWRKGVERGG